MICRSCDHRIYGGPIKVSEGTARAEGELSLVSATGAAPQVAGMRSSSYRPKFEPLNYRTAILAFHIGYPKSRQADYSQPQSMPHVFTIAHGARWPFKVR